MFFCEICVVKIFLMVFVDTHAHYCDEAFASDADSAIDRALEKGVAMMLQPDVDSKEREAMHSLVARRPDVLRPMLGLYPGSVGEDWREELDAVFSLRNRKDFVAIGEIGLDYHYGKEYANLQKEVFAAQLELAAEMGLPVNIHLREATGDFFDILEARRHLGLRGNLHAFSGSPETFRRMERLGDWYVGIGGVLTFKKASIANDILEIPLERIVLETDAPYLAPTPLRGTRNESANIPLIAGTLASIKGVTIGVIASRTTENAVNLFSLGIEISK